MEILRLPFDSQLHYNKQYKYTNVVEHSSWYPATCKPQLMDRNVLKNNELNIRIYCKTLKPPVNFFQWVHFSTEKIKCVGNISDSCVSPT